MSSDLEKIHNPVFEKEIIELTIKDIKNLALKAKSFVESDCPTCSSAEFIFYYEIFGLNYYKCTRCGTAFLNPCPTEEIIVQYLNQSEGLTYWRDNMPEHVTRSRKEKLYADRVRFIERQIIKYNVTKTKFLDIGGGNGYVVEGLIEQNIDFAEYIIIEPQPLQIDLPKVRVIQQTMNSIQERIDANVAVAFEVIEHVIDPRDFLASVYKLLADEGILILSTPNVDGFETSTLKEKSTSCWFDHIRLYNASSIRMLLENAGFKVLSIETPGELDVEIVGSVYLKEKLDFSLNPALKFMMEDGLKYKKEFQEFLVANQLSSHLKCIAQK